MILDVVYNHLGPDGNYLWEFARDYFSTHYRSEWGDAINFDGPNCSHVREYFLANATYWIQEFHLDGLRIDATQQIFDSSRDHILAAITQKVREAAHPRSTLIVGENEPQKAVYFLPCKEGGYGIDTMWNDDFHHSCMVAMTGRADAYYSDHRGTPQEFVSAVKRGYLYQGQWYSWQKQPRGTPVLRLAPWKFVNFLQNHDRLGQPGVGRRRGDRPTSNAPELDPREVDEVFGRCCAPAEAGVVAPVIARRALMKAGLPATVPSLTLDRACCSSIAALQMADRAIRVGDVRAAVVFGVENLSASRSSSRRA